MANYNGIKWNGALDTDYWIKTLNNAKNQAEAVQIVKDAMDATAKGGLIFSNVSDDDQAQVVKILDAFADKYNLKNNSSFNKIYNTWDPKNNHINGLELNDAIKTWSDVSKSISTEWNYVNGVTNSPTLDTTNNNTTTAKSTRSSNYGGGGGGYAPISNPNALTKDDLDDFANQLKAELEALNQKPEPKSAAEIARIHNIDYNLDNILADYNNTTNQYYDAAIAEQNQLRNTFNRDNAYYVNGLIQDYYDSYRNQAATAINKGNLAANMLATNLAANDTNSATDLGMLQSINQLDEARKAELLQNRVEAENYYNNLGKTLAGFSTDYYNSDINSYIGAIEKYSQMYSANRILARAQAEAAAQRYSGLANAAVSNAQAVANSYNNNYYKQLYDYYSATGDPNPALSTQNIINGQNKYTIGGVNQW